MKTFSLATRNLARNRRRSMATLLATLLGTLAILIFGGYKKDISYNMQTTYIRNGGHLQILHRDFFLYGSGNPTAYGIAHYQQLLERVRQDPQIGEKIAVITPTLQFGGIAGNYAASVSRTVMGLGQIAADQNKMRQWDELDSVVPTAPLALAGAPRNAAISGYGVARVLQLCEPLKIDNCPHPQREEKAGGEALPDDIASLADGEVAASETGKSAKSNRAIELLASTTSGAPNVASLEVIKAENMGFKELDEVFILLQLEQAQSLVYGKSEPRATGLSIQLHHSADIPFVKARIEQLLQSNGQGPGNGQPLTVMDFAELNPYYVQAMAMFDTMFGFLFVLIAGIVLFTVSNTMNTSVMERTVEIGTLRAIGLRRAGIQRLFVTEGVLLGGAGALIGTLLSMLISVAVHRSGLTWTPPGAVDAFPIHLRVYGEWTMMFGTLAGILLISVLSAWIPARRASKLDIVEALRRT